MVWFLAVIGMLVVFGAAYLWRHMRRIEPERVEVVYRTVILPNLPPELDGMRICQVSDVHITEDPRNSRTVGEAICSVEADLYALTGDLIHGPAGIEALDAWLTEYGRCLTPAVAVFGNAEHKRRIALLRLKEVLEKHGVRVLCNEVLQVPVRGGVLQIVGLDDPHSGHSRATAAYAHADADLWTLVLVHSPEGIIELDGRRADLVLAGHTHGGQILLPGVGWISDNTHNRVGLISGLYTAADMTISAGLRRPPQVLYVSRGLGTSGWPLRFRCRPELPVLTLQRDSSARSSAAERA